MTNRYHDFNTSLRKRFGCRVQKITVDAGFSCPNRDGTLSVGGCIYCNPKGSGTDAHARGISITDQIVVGKQALFKRYKAKKFIAYFQSFTNTYGPFDQLKKKYSEALSVEDVVGLSIGTRPDCVEESVLDLLEEYAKESLIWVEYGLQSIHDTTLSVINRGHTFKSFQHAVTATKNRGIDICAHVILGLPGETKRHMLETAEVLAEMGIQGVKLHLLYVIKGTRLDEMFRENRYRCLTQEEYVDIVCDFLERLPGDMVIQRLTGDPHPRELAAPGWSLRKNETLALIRETLEKRDSRQGVLTDRPYSPDAFRV
jgi:radical SAM protein (TIGR01212 family)